MPRTDRLACRLSSGPAEDVIAQRALPPLWTLHKYRQSEIIQHPCRQYPSTLNPTTSTTCSGAGFVPQVRDAKSTREAAFHTFPVSKLETGPLTGPVEVLKFDYL